MRNEVKQLLQQSIDAIHEAKSWRIKMMSSAQKLGLQGEKRRQRYESAKYSNFLKFLICDSWDVYGFELEYEHKNIIHHRITSIQGYFEEALAKNEELYNTLHTIANKLVLANAKYYANYLYSKCDCIICDIKYYRRTIMEGDIVKWKPEFILLYQTTEENIHDEFEKKEKEVGYDYGSIN